MTLALLLPAAVLVGVLGLAVGSFTNVVIYRVPNGLSVVQPRSACPSCASPIQGRDNVPVLSWLLLGARCRTCAVPIPARYPLVELAGGVAFVGVAIWLASTAARPDTAADLVVLLLQLVALLYLATVSIALAMIDIDVHRLPDRIVLPSYAVGAVLLGAASLVGGDLESAARGAAAAGLLVALYFVLAMVVAGGMGLGDIKLAGVLGLYLGWYGWEQLVVGVGAGFLLGGLYATALLVIRRAGRKSGVPFGPWMLAGAWIGIFAGGDIADAYLSLVGLT